MRASGTRAVFVACGFGSGGHGYAAAFEDPTRFGRMMKRLAAEVGRQAKRSGAHARRLALVSWSAGFAAVSRILAVPEWYAATDAVVLLDSLHAPYVASTPPPANKAARGAENVDTRSLSRFIQFARDAAAGRKTMVITHTAIVPPDYASTAETTAALLAAIDVEPVMVAEGTAASRYARTAARNATGRGDLVLSVRADAGNLHVRGFRGAGPHDHFDHLHLIGDALRSWVVPRWYTPTGERP